MGQRSGSMPYARLASDDLVTEFSVVVGDEVEFALDYQALQVGQEIVIEWPEQISWVRALDGDNGALWLTCPRRLRLFYSRCVDCGNVPRLDCI
jgi:hypothetical protein